MSEDLLRWCVDQLHHNFGLELCEDIVQYILSINNSDEIEEYVGDLLMGTDGRKRQFIDELLQRWKRTRCQTTDNHEKFLLKDSGTGAESLDMTKDSQKKSKRKGRNKQEVMTFSQSEPGLQTVKTPMDLMKAQESNSSSSTKKKSKFVNLYAQEGQDKLAVILPGRHACECLAQKHNLINNCITCGRIVCEQEGSGPCLFCGSLVCTKEEQEILQRDSNKSQKLRKKLMGDFSDRDYLSHQETRMNAGLEKAIQHKDKLLEYDKNSVKRTQVLDDESDYFAADSNQWLSPSERDMLRKKEEELREIRYASRKDRKITLDFAGRQVIDEGDNFSQYYNKLDEAIKAMGSDSPLKTQLHSDRQGLQQSSGNLVNPNIMQEAPEWVNVGGGESNRKNPAKGRSTEEGEARAQRSRLRLQDKELQEMSDDGWCLSMHQPWASLLVKGIKRVEGRTWYTSHRGRLWIAAAAKRPTPQEIAEVEGMYRHIYKKEPKFPKDYPTGCLLGCVNMTDCLSQEQFREQHTILAHTQTLSYTFLPSSLFFLAGQFAMAERSDSM
ncbi:activating signal cointegrator 1 isoform X2 [Lampris incognitus]|uniref:activating signal cointegrator 1 isoform X2 n=1 Tax=Lampris incognitus TaxID=2546036 RepID=UPI0024B4A3B3|nr:activating signal cointegrator 1 isoform X2 [Lampris incognitus]